MPSPNDIRASRAYVELGVDDSKLGVQLAAAQSKVQRFTQEIQAISQQAASAIAAGDRATYERLRGLTAQIAAERAATAAAAKDLAGPGAGGAAGWLAGRGQVSASNIRQGLRMGGGQMVSSIAPELSGVMGLTSNLGLAGGAVATSLLAVGSALSELANEYKRAGAEAKKITAETSQWAHTWRGLREGRPGGVADPLDEAKALRGRAEALLGAAKANLEEQEHPGFWATIGRAILSGAQWLGPSKELASNADVQANAVAEARRRASDAELQAIQARQKVTRLLEEEQQTRRSEVARIAAIEAREAQEAARSLQEHAQNVATATREAAEWAQAMARGWAQGAIEWEQIQTRARHAEEDQRRREGFDREGWLRANGLDAEGEARRQAERDKDRALMDDAAAIYKALHPEEEQAAQQERIRRMAEAGYLSGADAARAIAEYTASLGAGGGNVGTFGATALSLMSPRDDYGRRTAEAVEKTAKNTDQLARNGEMKFQ